MRWKFRLMVALVLSLFLLPLALVLDPDLRPAHILGLLVLGILSSIHKVTLRFLAVASGICAVLIGLWLMGPLAPWLTHRLVSSEPPRAADLIVVLGGGMQCGAGQLEASSLGRLVKGLELWRAGYAPRISLSDTDPNIFGNPACPSLGITEQRLTEQLLGQHKPEIILLSKMRTTRTEAQAVAQIAAQRAFRTVMVVTAPTHTLRACGTFRQLGLKVVCVAAYEPRYDLSLNNPWDRWQAISSVLREYLGLWLYGWRGWL